MGFALVDAFSGGAPDYAGQAASQEAARQARITKGTTAINNAFAGFTPDFYSKAQQAYMDFALPQFANQYNQTKAQIGFQLANRGITRGSSANKQWSDLARQTAVGKQALVDQGIGVSQGLQKDVAGAKNDLLSQLYQSADPAGATAGATAAASQFQIPSSFAPIANQFSGLINQYYISQLLNNRPAVSPSAPSGGYGSAFAPLPQTSFSVS